MDPEDERFDAKVTVLMENVRHHVKEEEEEMFKDAKKLFSRDELNELGARMEQRKSELVKELSGASRAAA